MAPLVSQGRALFGAVWRDNRALAIHFIRRWEAGKKTDLFAAGSAASAAINGTVFPMLSETDPLRTYSSVVIRSIYAAGIGANDQPKPEGIVSAFETHFPLTAPGFEELPLVATAAEQLALKNALRALQRIQNHDPADMTAMIDVVAECCLRLHVDSLRNSALGRFLMNRGAHLDLLIKNKLAGKATPPQEMVISDAQMMNLTLQTAILHSLPESIAGVEGATMMMWHKHGERFAFSPVWAVVERP